MNPRTSGLPQDTSIASVRAARRTLRIEQARIDRWRRLLRAQIDLTVARASEPWPPDDEAMFVLPLDVALGAPSHRDLAAALDARRPSSVTGPTGNVDFAGGPADADHADITEVARLTRLRALETQLNRYGVGVDAALEEATERFISMLAVDPAATLDLLGSTAPAP